MTEKFISRGDVENFHTDRAELLEGVISEEFVADSFTKIAESYYDHKVGGEDPGNMIEVEPIMDLVINNGTLRGKGTVLEIGGGTGWFANSLLKRISPDKFIFNDVSEGMMEIAKLNLPEKHSVKDLEFVLGSMSDLSMIPNESVDVICSTNAMDCVPNLRGALEEQMRILKPGGRFVFSIRHPIRNFLYAGTDKSGWYLEEWEGTGGMKVPRRYRPYEEWMEILYQVGFKSPRVFRPRPRTTLKVDYPDLYDTYSNRPGALIFLLTKEEC